MRVLVTRPRAQADLTARRLAARGHDALVAPILGVVPTGAPRPPGVVEGVIVTSANAVPALAAASRELGALPVFAVGRRTAELLERGGFRRVLTPDADAAALVDLIARTVPPGTRLLHVAGRDRRPEPARSLRNAGYGLVVWQSYAALPVDALPGAIAEALRTGMLDAALHYSRRSASVLVGLARKAGLADALSRLSHACLSDEVATALEPLLPQAITVAGRPDEDSLFAALERKVTATRSTLGSRLPQSE